MNKSAGTKLYHWWQETLSIHRWVAFVLPMVVFMVLTSVEPKPSEAIASTGGESATSSAWIPYSYYPWVYLVKLFLTGLAIALVWPVYKPLVKRVGWKGVAVGLVGGVAWIAICKLDLERQYVFPFLKSVGLGGLFGDGTRSAFNPWKELGGNQLAIIAYLVIRGIGLVLLVPVMEEYFLRGFVIRYFAAERWWKYPIGQVTVLAAVVGTALPMLMHPGELLAAAVWFSIVTALGYHTKNLWECIVAHATTNLVLGIYVVAFGAWELV